MFVFTVNFFLSGKAAVLMLRAQVLKAARARAKAAAKAAKAAARAAAEAAANDGSPDVIVTNTLHNDTSAPAIPEVDRLTRAHQRAIAAVATLIQVNINNSSVGVNLNQL